jgi:GNAT superfamily N-acetyltransferase
MHPVLPSDIESIERATVAAVAPERLDEWPGWLLPMDSGTVGRARSAVPVHHGVQSLEHLEAIVQAYRAAGYPPALRLPEGPAYAPWHQVLQARGWQRRQPTWTQVGTVQALLDLPAGGPLAQLDAQPDAAWRAMYLGAGLDPVDGASRARALARAQGLCYASVRRAGETVACGAASYSHGWLGVHGMRTAAAQRGQGLAAGVLRAMAQEARQRGIERVFLQVDQHNAPALALYRRAGLEAAWGYAYWRLLA